MKTSKDNFFYTSSLFCVFSNRSSLIYDRYSYTIQLRLLASMMIQELQLNLSAESVALIVSYCYFTWHRCSQLWAAAVLHQFVLAAIFPASFGSCLDGALSAADACKSYLRLWLGLYANIPIWKHRHDLSCRIKEVQEKIMYKCKQLMRPTRYWSSVGLQRAAVSWRGSCLDSVPERRPVNWTRHHTAYSSRFLWPGWPGLPLYTEPVDTGWDRAWKVTNRHRGSKEKHLSCVQFKVLMGISKWYDNVKNTNISLVYFESPQSPSGNLWLLNAASF